MRHRLTFLREEKLKPAVERVAMGERSYNTNSQHLLQSESPVKPLLQKARAFCG